MWPLHRIVQTEAVAAKVMSLPPFAEVSRKLESSVFQAESHWIPASAGMTAMGMALKFGTWSIRAGHPPESPPH